MGKVKKHAPEQIVNILRQVEMAISNGKTTPSGSFGTSRGETFKTRCGGMPLSSMPKTPGE
jgi:hypothetical protein